MLTMRMILDGRKAGFTVREVVEAYKAIQAKSPVKVPSQAQPTTNRLLAEVGDEEIVEHESREYRDRLGKRRGVHCWGRVQRRRDGRLRRKRLARARARVVSVS